MRADSGFCAHTVVAACREMDVRFSITIRQRASLRDLIEAIPEEDWTPIPYWMDGAADVAETACTPFQTKKHRIRLTADDQQELNALVSRGRAAAYKQTHAGILLMSDESRSDGGMKDADITSALGVGQSTVERIRKRCVEEGVESALNRKKRLRRRQKRLDGEGEARLIAMACGEPPEGRASWTLKLLADQLVECEIVETISTETVRQALKETN